MRPPCGWLEVARSGLCQHQLSYDIYGFSVFALNSAAAYIAFRVILWQLLRVPLFLSPLPLHVWIFPLSKCLCLLLRITLIVLPSWGSFSLFSSITRYVFFLSFPVLTLRLFGCVWRGFRLFCHSFAFLYLRPIMCASSGSSRFVGLHIGGRLA